MEVIKKKKRFLKIVSERERERNTVKEERNTKGKKMNWEKLSRLLQQLIENTKVQARA